MENRQIVGVLEGLLFLGGGAVAYTGNTPVGALLVAVAGLLRLVEEFV